jgi:hypothetical protein
VSAEAGGPVLHPVIELRRGVTVRGRVLDSDGKPVPSALLFAPTYIPEGMEVKGHPLPVRDGRFELPGCEPGAKVGAWFYDPRTKTGAVAVLKTDAEAEVRLAPCVPGRLRVLDSTGRPVAGARLTPCLAFRPGDDMNTARQNRTDAELTVYMTHVCGRGYAAVEQTDGEYLLPNLIPGATYTVDAQHAGGYLGRATFTVPPAGSTTPAVATLNGLPPRK